jgi:serine/threonine-protein kinase
MAEATTEKRSVKIGDYVITGKIGRGGVAEIYKGRQESLDRDVAIKVLSAELSDDPDLIRRFERESLVIARLSHPNIVHVIDKGRAGNRYYFAMEYVDGTSLREVIDSDRIELKTKLDMVIQVCKALDYAHKNGIIHRDIKPTNILIDRQGNARVADFGIAQIIGTPDGEMTSSDMIMGTMAYMSPEQKVSSTNVDQTTDIFAMGIILYEILAGRKPDGRFRLPSEVNPCLGTAFDMIVLKSLAQEPKDRYQSAVELKDALLEVVGGSTGGHRTSQYAVAETESFVGKCRYLDTIKETRFGSTVLVENKVNKRLYVIKRHQTGDAGRKEAKLLTSLKHANIINILGSGGDKRSTVIISEYAQGGSLADRMVRRFGWQAAMKTVVQVAASLDFTHKNGIVHGNLRPSNILFDSEEVVKLTDFGLPAHYGAGEKKNCYGPPERKSSRQGDIYSMGVILHRMITGRYPQHDAADNLWLDDVKSGLPEDVIEIMRKLLAIRISHRYKTAEEMILDWEDSCRRRLEAERADRMLPSTPEPSKAISPTWVFVASAVGLLAVIVVVLLVTGAMR